MYRIEFSPKSLEDLHHLEEYLISNWGDKVAKAKLSKLISSIKGLEQFPLSGVNLSKVIDVATDYSYIFVEKNYVFYYIEVDKIRIIRVFSENQDYIRHLFLIKEI